MITIPKISLFGLLIVLPVFISYGDYGLGIDRVGGLTQGYYITIPMSLIVAVLISLKSLNSIVSSKYTFYFFFFSFIRSFKFFFKPKILSSCSTTKRRHEKHLMIFLESFRFCQINVKSSILKLICM